MIYCPIVISLTSNWTYISSLLWEDMISVLFFAELINLLWCLRTMFDLFHFCSHLKRNCNSKINNFFKFPSIYSIQNEKIQNDTILNFTAPLYKRQNLVKSSTVMAIPRYHLSEFFFCDKSKNLQQLNKICWSFHINHKNLDEFP